MANTCSQASCLRTSTLQCRGRGTVLQYRRAAINQASVAYPTPCSSSASSSSWPTKSASSRCGMTPLVCRALTSAAAGGKTFTGIATVSEAKQIRGHSSPSESPGRLFASTRVAHDADKNDGLQMSLERKQSQSASEVLTKYTRQLHESTPLSLTDLVEMLETISKFSPSIHDERLHWLVQDVISRKGDLSLSNLVVVSRLLHSLGFHEELVDLTKLVVESASFLSSDVVMAFSKIVSIAMRPSYREGGLRGNALQHGLNTGVPFGVFRILGEHIKEAMFDAAPNELCDALLAIATFYCSKNSTAPDPSIVAPWHHDVFASSAAFLTLQVENLSSLALVKCLRAYKLFLLAGPQYSEAIAESHRGTVEQLPSTIAATLCSRLPELTGRHIVRSFHALAVLHVHGVRLDPRGVSLCRGAIGELRGRIIDLSLLDIVYALHANAALANTEHKEVVHVDFVQALFSESGRHVPSLSLRETLMLIRSAQTLAPICKSTTFLDLLAAEVLRELPKLSPFHVCDAAAAFTALRLDNIGFFHGLVHAFSGKLPQYPARQMAVTLHNFAKVHVLDDHVCSMASEKILKDFIEFMPRDITMSVWAFAKVSYCSSGLFNKVQVLLRQQDISAWQPVDISCLLWSLGRLEIPVHSDVLSALTHFVAGHCSEFSDRSIVVTCLALARLGFAQQPVLVELYRSLYARLPGMGDSQIAFTFFLFSTSGVRDEALLHRFLFECQERMPRMRGQDLGNIVLALSRTVTPTSIVEPHTMRHILRQQIFGQLEHLKAAPLLGVYIAAPSLLELPREDNLRLANTLVAHIPDMDASELARALFATARAELLHKPILLPLFLAIRSVREQLSAHEVVSCIWSVYTLGFCKPKFRKVLGTRLMFHVKRREIAPRALRDVLPALSELGFWGRLKPSLQRSIWRLASHEIRMCASAPPPAPSPAVDEEVPDKRKDWCLPRIQKNFFRRHPLMDRPRHLEMIHDAPKEELEEHRDVLEATPAKRTAVDEFVAMVRKL